MNKIAQDFLERSKRHLGTAHSYFYSRYPDTIEEAQKAVELALKALLKEYIGDYPEEHDLSRVLYDNYDRFPLNVKEHIVRLATISRTMEAWRLPATYGRKKPEVTPGEIFSESFIDFAYKVAEEVYNICQKVLK